MEPHSEIPRSLELPAGYKRWKWAPLLPMMVAPLGLREDADTPDVASQIFQRATAGESDSQTWKTMRVRTGMTSSPTSMAITSSWLMGAEPACASASGSLMAMHT